MLQYTMAYAKVLWRLVPAHGRRGREVGWLELGQPGES